MKIRQNRNGFFRGSEPFRKDDKKHIKQKERKFMKSDDIKMRLILLALMFTFIGTILLCYCSYVFCEIETFAVVCVVSVIMEFISLFSLITIIDKMMFQKILNEKNEKEMPKTLNRVGNKHINIHTYVHFKKIHGRKDGD